MATKTEEFDELASASEDDVSGSEYSGESEDERQQAEMEAKMKALKDKKAKAEDEAENLSQNAKIEERHRKKLMAFAPMWFISPFMVLVQALINIVAASITLNTTTVATCTNVLLPVYAGGQLVLSYVFVILFGSLFIGLCKIRWSSMFSVKLVGYAYILVALVWNLIGTIALAGSRACKVTTPQLHSLTTWMVFTFWITLAVYVIAIIRTWYLAKFSNQRSKRAAQAERIKKLEAEDRKLKQLAREEEEARLAAEAEEEAAHDHIRVKRDAEEQKRADLAAKYGVSSDEDDSDSDSDAAELPGATGGFKAK